MARLLTDDTFTVKESDLPVDGNLALSDDITYTIRPISTKTAQGIIKRHTRRTRRGFEEQNTSAIHSDMLDLALTAWSGKELNGTDTPPPCDIEHKLQLPVSIQTAILEQAQAGRGVGSTEASFRQPESVRGVSEA